MKPVTSALRSRALDTAAAIGFRLLTLTAVLFLTVPIAVSVLQSFDDRTFLGPLPPPRLSLRWYRSLLDNPVYLEGLLVSVRLALGSTAVSVAVGTAAAIALARTRFRGRAFLESLFLSPRLVPTIVIGFSLLGFTAAVHVFDAFTRLVFGHIVITLPFTIRAALASLIGIRRSLVEAALSLGATPARALFDVTLPLARTGIIAGALLAFVLSFDELAVSLFLADAFTPTLPIAVVAEMRTNLNLTVAAISTVFAVLTVLTVLVLECVVGLDKVIGQGLYRN
jgi:putative spermidine/putrescine transport system permease protein